MKTCENCGYEVKASKKYVSVQLMLKHKDSCISKRCPECDYKVDNKQEWKRHRRDEHGIISGSTSTPTKKKKNQSNQSNEEEALNVENPKSDNEEENIEDISLKLEAMEIDVSDEDSQENIKEALSNLRDEKIKEKEKESKEREVKEQTKRRKLDLKKHKEK